MFPPQARLESLEVVALVALFVCAALPLRRGRRRSDDAAAAMQAVVLRVEEDGQTRSVSVSVPVTIGRAPSATLVIPDSQVSRVHARIDVWDGAPSIRDLDSRNGTLVNARPIEGATVLRDGDEIDIGMTRIVFCGVGAWK
jgi:pSer/pThr/pTyr-binding forkhead associated (FHA) protein